MLHSLLTSSLTPPQAFSTCLLALGAACGTILRNGPQAFTFLYDKWVGLASAALLMSVVQAVYVYAASFRSGKLLALGGNSGNFIYDVGRCFFLSFCPC